MQQNLEYTVVRGRLSSKTESTQISFALITEEEGLFRIATFLEDDKFYERNEEQDLYGFSLNGTTEKGYEIECTGLYMSRYAYANRKFELTCHGHLKLTKPPDEQPKPPPPKEPHRPRVWFVEIEGLRIKHSDYTRLHKERNISDKWDFPESKFDHTHCYLMLNGLPNNGNSFTFTIHGGHDGTNAVIDFHLAEGYSKLHWDEYNGIKDNLIRFLSLINGAPLMIRKEYTGDRYRHGEAKRWASVEYVHSFKRLVNKQSSEFLPVHYHHGTTRRVFMAFSGLCFDNYCKLQDELALNEAIDTLHESFGTFGIEESFYILVTLFEKLSSKLAQRNKPSSPPVASALFASLKKEITQVVQQHRTTMNSAQPGSYEMLLSRIGNLNNAKRSSQDDMHSLLTHARIPISRAVRAFLDTERHESVHRGIVGGNDDERYKNYLKLDNMIRDIILNLIDYEGPRRRRVAYFSEPERIHKEEIR